MSNRFTELTSDFSQRARKYAGGRIHFMIDGTNIATEGYMFKPEELRAVLRDAAHGTAEIAAPALASFKKR